LTLVDAPGNGPMPLGRISPRSPILPVQLTGGGCRNLGIHREDVTRIPRMAGDGAPLVCEKSRQEEAHDDYHPAVCRGPGPGRLARGRAGDPVVLLHSFPQHWYAWRHVVPLLAGQYRLICPDWRGFGWSEAPPGGYDTAGRAADVLALPAALGLHPVCP
jgi:pimeloyl-ACP methyl ester carboxylesterase